MADLIVAALKLPFGLLLDKAYSKILERFKCDEDFLPWIQGELDEIKHKLDFFAGKDLQSSISFLQEGINKLHQCLQQVAKSEDTSKLNGLAALAKVTSSQSAH